MTIEFSRSGKTYQCAVPGGNSQEPPATITIPFRPCPIRPAFHLELRWLGHDEVRGLELYRPIREVYS